MILFEVQRMHRSSGQFYLESLYKALFALAYYGMMRIGEVTKSDHVLKARDVHAAANKDKLMVILYTSKTHSVAKRPQKIKITSNTTDKSGFYKKRNFCPFVLVNQYISTRFDSKKFYSKDSEQFFIFKYGSPVTPDNARAMLKVCLRNIGLDPTFYGMHSFRIGRTTDLIKSKFYSLEEVKHMGRWRSNTIYKYIKF